MKNHPENSSKEKSEKAVEKPEAREAVEAQTPKVNLEKESEKQREPAVVVSMVGDTNSTQDSVLQGHKVNKDLPKCDSQQQIMKGSNMIEKTITSVSAAIEEAKTLIANVMPVAKSAITTTLGKIRSLSSRGGEATLNEEEICHHAREE